MIGTVKPAIQKAVCDICGGHETFNADEVMALKKKGWIFSVNVPYIYQSCRGDRSCFDGAYLNLDLCPEHVRMNILDLRAILRRAHEHWEEAFEAGHRTNSSFIFRHEQKLIKEEAQS